MRQSQAENALYSTLKDMKKAGIINWDFRKIKGRKRNPDGTLQPIKWENLNPGQKARLNTRAPGREKRLLSAFIEDRANIQNLQAYIPPRKKKESKKKYAARLAEYKRLVGQEDSLFKYPYLQADMGGKKFTANFTTAKKGYLEIVRRNAKGEADFIERIYPITDKQYFMDSPQAFTIEFIMKNMNTREMRKFRKNNQTTVIAFKHDRYFSTFGFVFDGDINYTAAQVASKIKELQKKEYIDYLFTAITIRIYPPVENGEMKLPMPS